MDAGTLYVALGATIAMLVSLGAAGISIAAWLRPSRDLERLAARVRDLASLRTEWQNTLDALDSMNRRADRLARAKPRQGELAVPAVEEIPRGRTFTLGEVQKRNGG